MTGPASPDRAGDGRRTEPGRRRPRLARALALSFLWPGLGLIDVGARRLGAVVALSTALPAAAGLWWLSQQPTSRLAGLAVRPDVLQTVLMASLVLLVGRIALALRVAAVANGDGGTSWPWTTRVAVAVAATAVAVPHIAVADYAGDQLDLLGSVFASADSEVAMPTPLEGPGADGSATGDGSDPADQGAGDQATAAEPEDGDDDSGLTTWNGRQRVTVALLGSDSGFDRDGVRTDSIIVVSLDVATGDAAAFSVPRNWERMPFPGGTPADRAFPRGFDGLAYGIYKLGEEQPELFPRTTDPGGTAIKQSLAQLLGIPVDHYVMVDMRGVVETVDLFGGIDLTITEAIADGAGPIEPGGPPLVIDAEPGRHHFDGLTTLAYARARQQSSDYSRMDRQRCVIEALVDQVSVLEMVRRYDDLRSIMARHVTTDIPVDDLPVLLEIAERLDTQRITSVSFVPPTFPTGAAPVELVREAVDDVLRGAMVGVGTDAGPGDGALWQESGVRVPWPDRLDDATTGVPHQPVVPWPDRLDDPTTGIDVEPFVPWPDRLDAAGTLPAGGGAGGDRSTGDSDTSDDTVPPASQGLAEACAG